MLVIVGGEEDFDIVEGMRDVVENPTKVEENTQDMETTMVLNIANMFF